MYTAWIFGRAAVTKKTKAKPYCTEVNCRQNYLQYKHRAAKSSMVWIRVYCVAIAASYFPLCLLNSSFILYFSFAWSVVFPFATASNRSQIAYESSDVRSLARALTAKMFWICSCMTPTSAVLYGVGVFVQSGEKQKRAGTSPIALNSKQLPSDAELRFGFDGFLSIHLSCCLCSSR